LLSGTWWIDLGSTLAGGRLAAGASTTRHIVTIQSPTDQRLGFKAGVIAQPYANVDPDFDSQPVTTAQAGQAYRYHAAAHAPHGSALTYLLSGGPDGLTVDAATGLVSWTPTAGSPATASVALQVYNLRGGHISQEFTITVAGVNRPPVFAMLDAQVSGR